MTEKLKLLGLGKEEGRVSFTFKKNIAFLETFPAFLFALELEKTATFYGFEDNLGLFSTMKPEDGLKDLSDIIENTRNEKYDLDIFFGSENIIVIIRTKTDEQQSLLQMLKKIAEFPQQ
ncbi:MAG: hypothetical protein WC852_00655 [Candidatus Nanoarchaeia archaeon]|jgi:hypothetical protein